MHIFFTLATMLVLGIAGYVTWSPRPVRPYVTLPQVITAPELASPPSLDLSKVVIRDTLIGKGEIATEGARVTVNYRGTLTDGTEFDSSYGTGREPLRFVIGKREVVPGFDHGVKGMRVGGKRTITIPPQLGYGDRAQGDKIPANSTLIFDIALEKVELSE